MINFLELQESFIKKGLTLGSIESFTGGSFASHATAVPGASNYFKGAIVTYATEEKERILGIPHEDVLQFGVVSKEIAEQMAKRGQEILNVAVAVSFTGNAGPSAMENKPVGEIYIGIAYKNKVQVFGYHLQGERKIIQEQAISLALDELKKL